MAFVSLYRKYRSQTFGDLAGQSHVVRTLQNALASERIAHAYLFTGPRGTGKTSTARLLAKALNCEKGPTPEPCNECDACASITVGNCFDVFEMDAASDSGVDEVREKIVAVAEYPPGFCRYKIFILDEVHDLSPKAFDALLKTIEEPPAYLVFILATTEYQKVPPTIRSRCQKFEFHRGSMADISDRLRMVAQAEGIEAEPGAIGAIARMSDGGFRDALTLLEQAMLTSDGPITLQHVYDQLGLLPEEAADGLLLALKDGDAPRLIERLAEVIRTGRDPKSIVESLVYRLADLSRSAYGLDQGEEGAVNASQHEAAAQIGTESLLALRRELAATHRDVRDVSLPRLWLEAELLRVASAIRSSPQPHSAPSPASPPPSSKAAVQAAAPRTAEPSRPTAANSSETPAPASAPLPALRQEPTGDPSLDAAIQVWGRTVLAVGSVSRTLGTKLASTQVRSLEGNLLTIAFDRKIEMDSVLDGKHGPAKRKTILEELHKAAPQPWEIRFVCDANGAPDEEPAAVELPAEGQRLRELAREVFPGT